MKTITGVVENGVVKLPPKARVRDGSKVIMMVMDKKRRRSMPPLDPKLDEEDAQFVRACRRSINEAMRAEEE